MKLSKMKKNEDYEEALISLISMSGDKTTKWNGYSVDDIYWCKTYKTDLSSFRIENVGWLVKTIS